MEFKWKRFGTKRKILIEHPDIVYWRSKYLRTMKKYRDERRNIIYIYETWMDNNLTFSKGWQSNDVFRETNTRLIKSSHSCTCWQWRWFYTWFILNVQGWVKHWKLLWINEWNKLWEVVEKFFLNIPSNNIIVLMMSPTTALKKTGLCQSMRWNRHKLKWLEENKIPFFVNMKKDQLFEMVQCFKLADKIHIGW